MSSIHLGKPQHEDDEDFSDLLAEIGSELQTAKDTEERILKDIRKELDRTGAAIGKIWFLYLFYAEF